MSPTTRIVIFVMAALLWLVALALAARVYRRLMHEVNELLRALQEARRRVRREQTAAQTTVAGREQAVLLELLPVLDNLERALQAAPPSPDLEAGGPWATWVAGVQMTRRQFLDSLERLGVRPVDAAGRTFDPRFHEAAATVDDASTQPGTVVKVLQAGFVQGDRLLRPARVTVSR